MKNLMKNHCVPTLRSSSSNFLLKGSAINHAIMMRPTQISEN